MSGRRARRRAKGRGAVTDDSGPLGEIRSILASGRTDAEIVRAIRRLLAPRPAAQHVVELNHRRFPVLCSATAWERHDDPEMS